MNLVIEVEECCANLSHNRITERKKSTEKLSNLLEKKDVIALLNEDASITWRDVLSAVQDCLKREADKAVEDARKKSTTVGKVPSSDLFIQVVKIIVREAEDKIKIPDLVGYIIGCMRDCKMKKCYDKTFLSVLHDYILSNSKCRGRLEKDAWKGLYHFLKKLCEEHNTEYQNIHLPYKCFMTLIKWGPLAGLPAIILREDFGFITKLCQIVNQHSPKTQQEIILEMAIQFCIHTAKDNRFSCCKFGEDIWSHFLNLYELNGREAKIKEQIVEFCFLQVTIHHPDGAYQNNRLAYASSWNTWQKCLKLIFSILMKEIHFYFKYNQKNVSFFQIQGNTHVISRDFLMLFVEVSRQLFTYPDVDFSLIFDCTISSECPSKRQKLDISLRSYIANISETKAWLWIHIVCKILEVYPKLIEPDDYLYLLEILSNIQVESNDDNAVKNIYACLSVMVDVQGWMKVENLKSKLDNLWKTVGETTTRAFALNQHKEVTEKLLLKLVQQNIVNLNNVLQTYKSGILNITVQSIDVLNAGFPFLNLATTEREKKDILLNCVLSSTNMKDYKYLLDKKTARLLTNLTLKQWPLSRAREDELEKKYDKYSGIKDIYFKSLLEKELLIPKDVQEDLKDVKVCDIDYDVAQSLVNILENFISTVPESVEVLLGTVILLANILNNWLEYTTIEKNDVITSSLVGFMRMILQKDMIKNFNLFRTKQEREAKQITACVEILDAMFTLELDKVVVDLLKNLIPLELLQRLGEISNALNSPDQEGGSSSEWKFNLKKLIIKALSSFSCISGGALNKNQRNVLEILSKPDYNYNLENDYILLITFLHTLRYSQVGVIPESILDNIRNSIQDICEARYQFSDNAIEILNILHDLYPHFARSPDQDNKITCVALLRPFYDRLSDYGPDVSLALLKCLEQLCKVDPEFEFARWCDTEVIKFVPHCLCSDYQEVRLKAVETLVVFFLPRADGKQLQHFHRQEEVFAKMFDQSLAVFEVAGELTEEHRIDETISRTASVLHTFGSIIINCKVWIQECLFAFVKLSFKKGIDSIDKMLHIINRHMPESPKSSLLGSYLEYIIEKWTSEGFDFDRFPFQLFGCDNKLRFYVKYFETCVPFLIVKDKKNLVEAAEVLGITEKRIVEISSPKVFSRAICTDIENLNIAVIMRNQILASFAQVVQFEELKNILTEHLDQIVLYVLNFLTDEMYISEVFKEMVIFPINNLSVKQIEGCLRFIEAFLCGNQNIVIFLTQNNLSQLEKILVALKCNIYRALTTDDKLIALHRYTFFTNIVVQSMQVSSGWQFFFIRDSLYFLTNLIEVQKKAPKLVLAVCCFLSTRLKTILPTFSETFEHFMSLVIISLKNACSISEPIRQTCMEIMHFLIVQNSCHLMSAIEKLDCFPQSSDFDQIRLVHTRIKYGNTEATLEQEIEYFLQHEDLSTRQDSLIQLKTALAKEKVQLKQLYENLSDLRGFSEDCETSLLHRLISILAQMSCSTNEKVSLEAIKCLGELGPADLCTLVLQPEKSISDLKCTPFDLLSGNVVSLLAQYIVDPNIDVVKLASEALYVVLDSKEARKIADSKMDFGYGALQKKMVAPYYPSNKSSPSANPVVDLQSFKSKVNLQTLWCPDRNISHEEWIVNLACSLLESFSEESYLETLVLVCKLKPQFSECVFPLIVNLLLCLNNKEITKILSEHIDGFFACHWTNTVPKFTDQDLVTVNKKSVKCMLNMIGFVRMQGSFSRSRARTVGDLDINYLKVSKGAEFCASHFSALFYSELWCQSKIDDIQDEVKVIAEQRSSMVDIIYEHQGEEIGEALQNILRNAYKALGDLDALPGCGISFLLKPKFRVEHYKEYNKWDQVIHFYATRLSQTPNQSSEELLDTFKECGLYQVPLICATEEPQYESLWRLGQWDAKEKQNRSLEILAHSQDFEKYRFYSLKALHEDNPCSFEDAKKLQSLVVIENLRHTSFESSQNVYPILAKLQSVVEMEDFAFSCSTTNFQIILNKWKLQDDLLKGHNFVYVEPIVAQRMVMLKDHLKKHDVDVLKKYLVDLTLDFAALAKDEGYFKEGLTILENLKFMTDLSNSAYTRIQLMDAQLSWLVDNKLIARHILNTLCKSDNIDIKLKSATLKLSGQYMSETYSENRHVIIADYYLKSVSIVKDIERNADDKIAIVDTYDRLAQFADGEYQQIMAYMKSELFERKVLNMEKAKKTALDLQNQRNRTLDECRAAFIHNKNSNIDETEINMARQDHDQFLQIALKYYLKNLFHSDINNIRIFRTMSLFLENRNNSCISDTINTYLPLIPSYKYITMLPQLIPHITESGADLFGQKVNEIIEKCAVEHPHHTLPLLMSLANANKDKEFSKEQTKTSQNDARVATASKLLKNLKRKAKLSSHIDKLMQLSVALIDLAYYTPGDENKSEFNIPESQKIMKIQRFDDVLLPTYNLKVNPLNNYSDIVGISSFGTVYHPVGGMNAPKKITCRGTDGKIRSQLVKGKDDLRQDAVMQQVFTIMNSLLSTTKQTKNLFIRTYKIVPLSMRSGVLEWVDGSMPIGNYLVGDKRSKGAHQKYRPGDRTPAKSKDMFKQCAKQSADIKLRAYKAICREFKPVFHKFFEAYFPQPTVWYERRRAYIHSVATTSMCGYILGIGDRHVSNILIDTNTAEVIHIDFGIAFEQGKVLPTPETVPFRLTRDIVDGMGVSGVDGMFRRSCEKTLKVLRENAQTIITILEVLLYDPLYSWTVTSAEANKRQTEDEIEYASLSHSSEEEATVNVTAERTLLRLREKLQGMELGRHATIERQVGILIQQAIDPANLCKLFFGWQPYL